MRVPKELVNNIVDEVCREVVETFGKRWKRICNDLRRYVEDFFYGKSELVNVRGESIKLVKVVDNPDGTVEYEVLEPPRRLQLIVKSRESPLVYFTEIDERRWWCHCTGFIAFRRCFHSVLTYTIYKIMRLLFNLDTPPLKHYASLSDRYKKIPTKDSIRSRSEHA